MSFQINNLQTFELEECVKCGCTFAVTTTFQKQRRDDGQFFYCPNGHAQSYTKSTSESLRETVSILTNSKNRLLEQVDEATARAEAAEAKLAKLTKRKGK